MAWPWLANVQLVRDLTKKLQEATSQLEADRAALDHAAEAMRVSARAMDEQAAEIRRLKTEPPAPLIMTPAEACALRSPERLAIERENAIVRSVNKALSAPYFPMWSFDRWVVVMDRVEGPRENTEEAVARITPRLLELGWRVTEAMAGHITVEPVSAR